MALKPDRFFYKFFKRTDDNSVAMNVNATAQAYEFRVAAPAQGSLNVMRINFALVDGAITYGKFGGITALTNGLIIKAYNADDEEVLDFFDGESVKTNEDFALLAGVDSVATAAAGDDFLPVRWTLAKATGKPLLLGIGDYISITIPAGEDLSGLTYFRAMLQGEQK